MSTASQSGMEDQADARALLQRIEVLERQVVAAADYQALVNLQAAYGYYVDKARWRDAADLFAEDATLEIGGRGVFRGRERIHQFLGFRFKLEHGLLLNHLQIQPFITVAPDGLTAKARWRALIHVGRLGIEATEGEGIYENTYRKIDGVWNIQSMHYYVTYYVSVYERWDKGGVPLDGYIPGLDPDEPPTEVYGSYPEVYLPPFHYKNPVSGA